MFQVPSLGPGNRNWAPVAGDVLTIVFKWPLKKVSREEDSVLGANAQLKCSGDRKLWFVTFKVKTCDTYLMLLQISQSHLLAAAQ